MLSIEPLLLHIIEDFLQQLQNLNSRARLLRNHALALDFLLKRRVLPVLQRLLEHVLKRLQRNLSKRAFIQVCPQHLQLLVREMDRHALHQPLKLRLFDRLVVLAQKVKISLFDRQRKLLETLADFLTTFDYVRVDVRRCFGCVNRRFGYSLCLAELNEVLDFRVLKLLVDELDYFLFFCEGEHNPANIANFLEVLEVENRGF